jgi:hypothetical protein
MEFAFKKSTIGLDVPPRCPASPAERDGLKLIRGGAGAGWRAWWRRFGAFARAIGARLALAPHALASAIGSASSRTKWPEADANALEQTVTELRETVDTLRLQVRDLEERARPSGTASATLTLTLATRGMALKLSRQGQRPAQIARLLGVPQGEVLLLLKMQRLQGMRPRPESAEISEHSGAEPR